jgi:serine/threonine protein kinase
MSTMTSLLLGVIKLCGKVLALVDEAKSNKTRCAHLARRVGDIRDSLQLLHTRSNCDHDSESDDVPQHSSALNTLHKCLCDISEYLPKFTNPTMWTKVLKSNKHKTQFQELDQRLSNAIQGLQIHLQISSNSNSNPATLNYVTCAPADYEEMIRQDLAAHAQQMEQLKLQLQCVEHLQLSTVSQSTVTDSKVSGVHTAVGSVHVAVGSVDQKLNQLLKAFETFVGHQLSSQQQFEQIANKVNDESMKADVRAQQHSTQLAQLHRSELAHIMDGVHEADAADVDTHSQSASPCTSASASLDIDEKLLLDSSKLVPPPSDPRAKSHGTGSSAWVYRATFGALQVAVKVYSGVHSDVDRSSITARLTREVRIMRLVQHPNIIKMVGVVCDENDVGVVMEYVPLSLYEFLYSKRDGNPTAAARDMGWLQKLRVLTGISAAVSTVHEAGVVHRDISPHNILVYENGTEPKLIDFGIASHTARATARATTRSQGAADYRAPEVEDDDVASAPPMDVYSLGMMLYELAFLRAPWPKRLSDFKILLKVMEGKRPKCTAQDAANAKCPDGYVKLMQQCWAPDPTDRPTAAQVAEKLAAMHTAKVRIADMVGNGSDYREWVRYNNSERNSTSECTPDSAMHESRIPIRSDSTLSVASNYSDSVSGAPSMSPIVMTVVPPRLSRSSSVTEELKLTPENILHLASGGRQVLTSYSSPATSASPRASPRHGRNASYMEDDAYLMAEMLATKAGSTPDRSHIVARSMSIDSTTTPADVLNDPNTRLFYTYETLTQKPLCAALIKCVQNFRSTKEKTEIPVETALTTGSTAQSPAKKVRPYFLSERKSVGSGEIDEKLRELLKTAKDSTNTRLLFNRYQNLESPDGKTAADPYITQAGFLKFIKESLLIHFFVGSGQVKALFWECQRNEYLKWNSDEGRHKMFFPTFHAFVRCLFAMKFKPPVVRIRRSHTSPNAGKLHRSHSTPKQLSANITPQSVQKSGLHRYLSSMSSFQSSTNKVLSFDETFPVSPVHATIEEEAASD